MHTQIFYIQVIIYENNMVRPGTALDHAYAHSDDVCELMAPSWPDVKKKNIFLQSTHAPCILQILTTQFN